MQNAVIYARFSSSRQREESIEGQVKECRAFAARNGYKVVEVYADRAISGRTTNRPEFQRMINDSASKLFKIVLVYTFDRFARDSYASAMYKHKLAGNGVRVVSINERTDDSPAGTLMERVFEGFAEYYSLELGMKAKRGMRTNAEKGIYPAASPFGYTKDKETGKLVPVPEEAQALKKVFEMAAHNATFVDIARFLNGLGFRPPIATKHGFSYMSVLRVLRNPIVIDKLVWSDVTIENYNNCRIVSDELFYAVQTRLKNSRRRGRMNTSKSVEYTLSGKVFCALCGKPMTGSSGTSRTGEKHYYYRCSGTDRRNKVCNMPSISRDLLEDGIKQQVISVLQNDDVLRLIAEEATKIYNESAENDNPELLKRRLAQAKQERTRLIDAIAAIGINDALKEKFVALEEEISDLETEIKEAPVPIPRPKITEEMVLFFFKHMREQESQELINTLVKKVVVNKEDGDEDFSVAVYLNYANSTPETGISLRFPSGSRETAMAPRVGLEPTTP